ncbi:MAG: 6-pyruvoyl tetrahydropterin synthase family protein [Hyphomicrobiales bacterium]
MSVIRLTKEFRFEMAHALLGYDGPCKNIHGHSYVLEVTIIGTPSSDRTNPKHGMVMDFGDLKRIVYSQIVDKYDHALVLNREVISTESDAFLSSYEKVIYSDYQPTSENMVIDFAQVISECLPKDVKLYSLKLKETATSIAEWYASDNI